MAVASHSTLDARRGQARHALSAANPDTDMLTRVWQKDAELVLSW
jgi:hypothetical protein